KRHRIIVDAEPTAKGKANRNHFAAAHASELNLLFPRVRAISMNPQTVANQKTYNRRLNLSFKTNTDSHRQRRSSLDDLHAPPRTVTKFRLDDRRTAVTVTISVLHSRRRLTLGRL